MDRVCDLCGNFLCHSSIQLHTLCHDNLQDKIHRKKSRHSSTHEREEENCLLDDALRVDGTDSIRRCLLLCIRGQVINSCFCEAKACFGFTKTTVDHLSFTLTYYDIHCCRNSTTNMDSGRARSCSSIRRIYSDHDGELSIQVVWKITYVVQTTEC